MYIHDNLDWIWQIYKNVRKGDLVIRSGFGLCGVYKYLADGPIDYRRPESDSEHTCGCIEIARNLSRAFPELFFVEEWLRIFDLLKYHDLGEITYGDRPDDGTQNTKEKNTVELDTFMEVISPLPTHQANILLQDFLSFQKLDSGLASQNASYNIACFCKLCDKLDAVLHAIFYELNGVGGDLSYKEQFHSPLSKRDKFYIQQTGTTKIAPNWAIHFLDICHNYPHFAMFFRILESAVKEINGGKFYDWLPKAQKTFGITNEQLHYCYV